MSILDYIERIKRENEGGRIGPRNMADGGRIGLKPGGIVEPGVEYYGKFTEAEKKANIKTWEENTGLKIKNQNKNVYGKVSRGETTGTGISG